MSGVIDNRVVQMEFDNQRFEKNVSTSISTLDKLKSALKLDGVSNGLSKIEQAARSFDLSAIGTAVESLSSRFSAFGVIGMTILQDIGHEVSKIVMQMKNAIDQLTVKQVGEGWTKYANKTSSVQTIMAATAESWEKDATSALRANELIVNGMDSGKAYDFAAAYFEIGEGLGAASAEAAKLGKTLSMQDYLRTTEGYNELSKAANKLGMTTWDCQKKIEEFESSLGSDISYAGSQMDYVNEQMEKLNWFTDETSYNFVDMVGNIGKFTANQIPLSQATTAMEGIATWAAISGQSVGEASRAMYNLAQSIGIGAVKLQDWKSIENANMATAGFKAQVLESAAALGVLTKTTDGLYKTAKGTEVSVQSFSQTLSEGWFNKDVLMDVLGKYGNFTDELYKVSEASGLTATDLLELVEAQKKNQLSTSMLNEAAGESSLSADALREKIEKLASEEYNLGYSAFKAAQEAKTFQEAMDATKDAASTRWLNIFENIFGDYERARHVWTDFANFLYDTLVAPLEKVEELSEAFVPPIDKFGKGLQKLSNASKLSEDSLFNLVKRQREGMLSQEALNKVAKEAGMDAKELGSRIEELAEDKYGDYVEAISEVAEKTGLSTTEIRQMAEAQKTGALTTAQLEAAAKKAGVSVDEMNEMIEGVAEVGSISGLDRVLGALKGIASVLLFGKENTAQHGLLGNLKRGLERVIPPLELTSDTFWNFLKRMQEWGESIKLSGKASSLLRNAGEGLGHVFLFAANSLKNFWEVTKPLRDSIVNLASAIANLILSIFGSGKDLDTAGLKFESLADIVAVVSEKINEWAEKLRDNKELVETITNALSGFWNILTTIGGALVTFIGYIWPLVEALVDLGASIGKVILKLFGLGNNLGDEQSKGEGFKNIIEKIAEGIKKLSEFISNLNLDPISGLFSVLGKIGSIALSVFDTVVGLLTGKGLNIDPESGIGKAVEWIKEKFQALKDFLANVNWGDVLKKGIGIGLTGGAFAGFIKLIQKLTSPFASFESIGESIGGVFDSLTSAIESFESKIKVDGLLKIAEAIALLAVALLILGLVNYENAIIGITAVGAILFGIYTALQSMDEISETKITAAAAAMLIAAGAMLVLAIALAALAGALALFALVAKMDTFGEGLGLMIFTLVAVVAAMELMSKMSPKVFVAAAAMLVLSVALIVLAGALAAFALVAKMDSFGAGLDAMIMVMVTAVGVLALMSLMSPKVLLSAAALIVLSVAMLILAGAFAAFTAIAGNENSSAGLAMFAAVLIMVVGALLLLQTAALGVLGAAAALLLVAAACLVLAVAIGVVSLVLPLLAYGLASLGDAIGSGLASIGAGAMAFLTDLGAGLEAVGESIGAIITSIGEGLGEAVAAFGTGLGDAIAAIGEGTGSAIDSIGTGIGDAITEVVSSVGRGIGEGIQAISDSIGSFGENLTSAGEGITAFGDGVRSLDGIKWTSTAVGVGELALALGKLNVAELATSFGAASTAVTVTCTSMVEAIKSVYSEFSASGEELVSHLIAGIKTKAADANLTAMGLSSNAVLVIRSASGSWNSAGAYLGDGLIAGIRSKLEEVQAAAAELAEAAAEALAAAAEIKSPSRVTEGLGEYWGTGFIKGISAKYGEVKSSTEGMVSVARKSLVKAESLVSNMLENDFTPVITPVLDLSNVEGMAGRISGLDVGVGVAQASTAASQNPAGQIQNGSTITNSADTYSNVVNVYAYKGQSPDEIADAVEKKLVFKNKQRAVARVR